MSKPILVSVVESMLFPDYGDLYRQNALEEYRVNSIRKAITLVKKHQPAFIVVEFFYAFSTNYSGIYKSNIEVLLVSLIKHSPNTKIIVLANKKEIQHVGVLDAVDYPLHGVLQLPTTIQQMQALLHQA